jgi:hypothetical protein
MPETLLCVVCRNILGTEHPEDTDYALQEDFMESVHICTSCARKDKVAKLIKKYTPLMQEFSSLVNNTLYDHDGTVSDALVTCFFQQHRYLQNEMIVALRNLFVKIGQQSGNSMYEDPRNQWALKWCREISKMDVTL